MCISGINFAFFYDFSSTSWNCYDGVVPFCCSFHIIIYQLYKHRIVSIIFFTAKQYHYMDLQSS